MSYLFKKNTQYKYNVDNDEKIADRINRYLFLDKRLQVLEIKS